MTRETRIGLLVGLAFIVMFGLVLGELTNSTDPEPLERAAGIREVSPSARQRIVVAQTPDSLHEAAHDEPSAPIASATDRPGGRVSASLVRPQDRSGSGGIILAAMQREAPPAPQRDDPPKAETYTVKAGDNGLWAIAEEVYGNGKHWKRIQQANPRVNTNELHAGQKLVIPPLDSSADRRSAAPQVAERRASEPRPAQNHREYEEMNLAELRERFSAAPNRTRSRGRTYVVRAGDNLTRIAAKTLGDRSAEAVGRLYRANQDKLADPDSLTVGMKLKIPD